MGTRDNNGVERTVYNNAGSGSINRGGGQSGVESDFNDISAKPREMDMTNHHGPNGSSGSVKANGGVGDKGAGEKWTPFKGEH